MPSALHVTQALRFCNATRNTDSDFTLMRCSVFNNDIMTTMMMTTIMMITSSSLLYMILTVSAMTRSGLRDDQGHCVHWSPSVIYSQCQVSFITKCQYSCAGTVLWCHVYSSHIHASHKTLNCNNSKHQTYG